MPALFVLRHALLLASLLIAPVTSRAEEAPVQAVATFSILADLVGAVGGTRVAVVSLVGPNGDVHVFQPSPTDVGLVARAKIIFANGLGLEGWMDRLVQASGSKAKFVIASQGVKPIRAGDEPAKIDPHAWQDVANVKLYVANIRDGLTEVDPAGADTYRTNASAYLADLDGLEAQVKAMIGSIEPSRRRIITTHDAFGYFAHAYGMEFIAPQGVSTESEASAKDVGKIIRQIKALKIPAVFLENVSDDRLIQRIAQESGAKFGARVYSDALSEPGGQAPTYLAMIRHNVDAFTQALRP